ncbi:NAD-dependent epimerase/dehydratase family protein [Foetidibacter luteolus]|uniref:NAD-dependent epimerase/dehydratase family protein n=1 Tax=Foetidibacter luteolus TaxID=2608880 RepID=UPI00129A4140|nr:NAD(P)-dependent oxidoreductase [Foetidibacter luteolus]
MKIAVFGGSGFLGLYLVQELTSRGYHVTIFDRLAPVEGFDNTDFYEMDIMKREEVIEAIVAGGFDIVYNLAGFANLDKAIKYPYLTMQLNVIGNINVLDGCVKAKVKRFVYASSAYAMSDKGSFYGISKLASEKTVEEYAIKYHLPFTVLRYGSVYSEMNFDNNYIYNLVAKAIQTGKIEHGGDGSEIREYIHASDAAKLSVDVIESEDYRNEHIIFTGTEKMKRVELFELIKEILGDKIEISLQAGHYHNHYKFTPYSYTPTLSRKLVANPHIDMGQGILECIKAVYRRQEELQANN